MSSVPPAGSPEPVAFDPASGRLRRGSAVVTLRPKDAVVLHELATRPGRLVTKAALIAAAWPDVSVTDAVLKASINRVRSALGDDPAAPRFIQTVHRRGYRFIGDLPEETGLPVEGGLPAFRWTGAPPIVGRAAEMVRLEHALADAVGGARRVVFVSGEAGLGKTALVDLFLKTRLPAEAIVGRGQCVERYGAGEAYMPLFEVLRQLGEAAGAAATSQLAEIAPGWVAQMPGLLAPRDMKAVRRRSAGVTRDRMLREFVDAITHLARERPVVMAIEDLHWSDTSTLDAVAVLARRRDSARLLLVGTYRPEEILPRGHPLQALARTLRVQHLSVELPLPLLSRPAVEAYLAIRFPGAAIPGEIVEAVFARTEGHPLFLAALADDWVASGWLTSDDGRWQTRVDLHALALTVPDDFRQMVEARLDRLAASDRRVLESAAVCGAAFTAASVAAAQQTEVVRVDERCAAIARRHLLLRADGEEAWPDGTRSGRYRFAHALYRDIAYGCVPAAARQVMHRRIAMREETGFGSSAGQIAARLAMHFEAAHEDRHAIRHRTVAARNAAAVGGFAEAIGHATVALDMLQALRGAAPADELALQLILGASRAATEGFAVASAERAYARARELSHQASDSLESFQALAGLFAYHLMRGPVDVTGEIGRRLLDCAERAGHAEAIAWGRMAAGVHRLQCGEMAAANRHFDAILALYDASRRDEYLTIHAVDPNTAGLGYSAWALWMLGCPSRALERGRQAIAFARRVGHPVDIAHAFVLQAHLHQFCQDAASTRACADAAITWSEEYGLGQYLWPARMMRGWARATTGKMDEGMAELQQAIAMWCRTGAQYAMPRHFALDGELHLASGNLAAAAEALGRAREALALSGERFWEPEIHRLTGELHRQRAATGTRRERDRALDEARSAIVQAIDVAREQGARSLELRAVISLCLVGELRADAAAPRKQLADLCRQFDEGERDHPDWRAAQARLRAMV